MANTFKNATTTGVNNSAYDDVLTSPTGNASKCVVIGLQLSNTSSSEITATVALCDYSVNASVDTVILNEVPIPANSMLSVLQGDKLILEEQDVLKVKASTGSALNAFVNYLLIDNT